MAELIGIRTGNIPPLTPGKDVPREQWKHLLAARGSYCNGQFQHDCSELLFYIDDGRKNNFFGYPDEVTYWRDGLCLEPEAVPFAENYLRARKARLEAGIFGRDWREISFDTAVTLGQREIGIEGGKPGPGRGHKTGDNITRFKRGTSRDYTLARLDRDGCTELAAQVRAGTLSANAAARAAGFRKAPTPLEQAHKLVPKLTNIEWQTLKRDEDARRMTHGR